MVIADQLHDGCRHLNLQSVDGVSFLVPAWMTLTAAASVSIVDTPCLSLARLFELRAFVDSVLASCSGEAIPEQGGVDDEASDVPAAGFVRASAAADRARPSAANEVGGAAEGAADGGDGRPGGGQRRDASIGGGR